MPDPHIVMQKTDHHIRVTDDGAQVVMIVDGRAVVMPPHVARTVARALYDKAAKVDELLNANNLIMDEAILLRAGVPLSLSDHPKIRTEAEKEAVSNRDLRRYMHGGVKSQEHVGAPVVTQPRTQSISGAGGVPSAESVHGPGK